MVLIKLHLKGCVFREQYPGAELPCILTWQKLISKTSFCSNMLNTTQQACSGISLSNSGWSKLVARLPNVSNIYTYFVGIYALLSIWGSTTNPLARFTSHFHPMSAPADAQHWWLNKTSAICNGDRSADHEPSTVVVVFVGDRLEHRDRNRDVVSIFGVVVSWFHMVSHSPGDFRHLGAPCCTHFVILVRGCFRKK